MLTHHPHRVPVRLTSALLGLLMLAGSLLLVAIPLGWLWILSQIGQPYLAVYFLALAGCPVMMIAWGMALVRLNRAYARISGEEAGPMLEVSLAISVAIAVLVLLAWLLLHPDGGGPVQGPWPG